MDTGNKTSFRHCRFLGDEYFAELHAAFTEAYSDYVHRFEMTEQQFRNHHLLVGVDLQRSVGFIDNGRIVGFSINGFGAWDGNPTAYIAATGVIPTMRRKGIAESIFEMMENAFAGIGIRQMLLEVISTYTPAYNLYRKMGFETRRELSLLECHDAPIIPDTDPDGVEFREVAEPDWPELEAISQTTPSWQNSNEAIARTSHLKTILVAHLKGECVGYAAFSTAAGRLAQIAVKPEFRRRGIASAFIRRMRQMAVDGLPLQVINSPRGVAADSAFFERIGFTERLYQYEMVKVY